EKLSPAQLIVRFWEHVLSPVTDRAIGQLRGRVDLVTDDQLPAQLSLRNRRLPTHRENFLTRAEVIFRRTVAIQTPFHVKGFGFPHERHAIDPTVTGFAADSLVDMNTVVEINEIGD